MTLLIKFDSGDIGEALRIPQNWNMYSPSPPESTGLPIAKGTVVVSGGKVVEVDLTRLLAASFPPLSHSPLPPFIDPSNSPTLPPALSNSYKIYRSIRFENNFSHAWKDDAGVDQWRASSRRMVAELFCRTFERVYGPSGFELLDVTFAVFR